MSIPEDFFTPGDTGEALHRSLTIIPTWDGPEVAPAGPPLHEQADRDADNVPGDGSDAWECDHHPEWCDDKNRCHHPAHDADNVPSDRVRAYAEAIRLAWGGLGDLPIRDWWPSIARAVMTVADREQAELREALERSNEAGHRACSHGESLARSCGVWKGRAKKAEADVERLRDLRRCEHSEAIARVEALAADWRCSDEWCDGDCTGCAYATDLRAALRGLEPTDAL